MSEHRVCIIGGGDRGSAHATGWTARSDAEIVAVCDADEARRALAEQHGAAFYGDYIDALASEDLTVVSVCVPTSLHADAVVAAAARGLHVLSEKPLALDLEQGRRIGEAVVRAGIVYSACFQHRDTEVYRLQRRLFREGRLGSPVHFRFTDVREVRPKTAMHRQSMNGGVVIDMACHMFDMVRFITGAEVCRLYASGHVFGASKPRLAGIEDLAIDAASIEFETDGGHLGSLYLNWGMPEEYAAPFNGVQLIGPLGSVQVEGNEVVLQTGDQREAWPNGNPGMQVRLERFTEAIRTGGTPDVTYSDAFTALRLSCAALESIRTRAVVDCSGSG